MKKAQKAKSSKLNWAVEVRKFKPQMNALTDSEWHLLLKEEIRESNGPVGEHIEAVRKSEKVQYSAAMKQRTPKQKARRREWLLRECERLRQECNHLTDEQRQQDLQRAFQIIYGTDATAPARRR